MKKTYDVLIAGAGPVGLWLACELKRGGVDVAVLERRNERRQQSRALTIHGRTLEVFALRGMDRGLVAAGKQVPTGHYAVLDTRLDFSPFETRFPFTLFLPQAETEAMIEQHATDLGVDILRGWTVTGMRDTGDGVQVTADGGEGQVVFSASYVAGADGGRSVIREAADIAFEGLAARNTLILADVVLGKPLSRPVVSMFNERGCVMIAPLGDGVHHRIVLIDPTRVHVSKDEPVALEEVAEAAKRITGEDHTPRDPIWMSRFTDETRLAARYRKGRVLLVGDAAHIHAPMGGQGMNVGLQDAMNLGWKLAAVVRGEAPDTLLDTYDQERRPVGESLRQNTLAQVALATHFDPATLALREAMDGLLAMPEVNRRLAGELSGFDVQYGKAEPGDDTGVRPGTRMPDIDLAEGRSLYSHMSQGNWLQVALDPDARPERPGWLADGAVTEVTGQAGKGAPAFGNLAALLIRPDGFVESVMRA
jgi:2-polyprenyl-6-methoxyphenol hydroxylase-like FAD-dependent oxidoreductase